MSLEIWLAFTAASAVMLVIPGPTILLVVAYALGHGRRVALPIATGVALGDFTALTLSLLGLGALLKTSAVLFTALKWLGALYLIWLGIKLFRAGGEAPPLPAAGAAGTARMLAHAWLVTALNPKAITFFVAFLPQFLDPTAPWLGQILIVEATFLSLAALNAFGYAILAGRARARLAEPRLLRRVQRTGGLVLIGAGIATLAVARKG
jgi:threonine/homoserine/homoserine lactone efflux protein